MSDKHIRESNDMERKRMRRAAKRETNRIIKDLQAALGAGEAPTFIQELKEELKVKWAELQTAHEDIMKQVEEATEEDEDKWLDDIRKEYRNIQKEVCKRHNSGVYSKPPNYSIATSTMQRNIATALPANARHMETWINLQSVEISELILQLVGRHGTTQDVEEVRDLLNNVSRIGKAAVQLVSYVIDGILHHSICLGNCRIPYFPIIKKIIHEPVADDTENDNLAANFIRSFVKTDELKGNLQDAYNEWNKVKADTIKKLRDIADEIDNRMYNSRIVKLATSMMSAAGAASALVALLATPVGIAAVGIIGVSGTATGVTAAMAGFIAGVFADKLVKVAVEYSNDSLKQQEETTKLFINLLDDYKQKRKNHMETARRLDEVVVCFKQLHEDRVRVTFEIGDSLEEEIGFVRSVEQVTTSVEGNTAKNAAACGTLGMIGINAVLNVADDALGLGLPLKNVKDAVKVIGVVTNVAVIAIDIYTIVKTALELSVSTIEAAKRIREAAQELESRKLPELGHAITQSLLEGAKEHSITVKT